jgi:hypothetical protein
MSVLSTLSMKLGCSVALLLSQLVSSSSLRFEGAILVRLRAMGGRNGSAPLEYCNFDG